MKETVLELAEGNPGAAVALSELVKTQSDAPTLLSTLQERDVRGPYVWVGYKDHCGEDVDEFAEAIRTKSDALFEEIEEYRELREDDSNGVL